jgi:hypothetical protein
MQRWPPAGEDGESRPVRADTSGRPSRAIDREADEMTTRRVSVLAAALAILPLTTVSASEIGQQVADQVQVASYQDYLDNELYTHDGDDRGAPDGADHDPARDNIQAIFESFGLQAGLHQFTYGSWNGANVVATQVGTVYPDAQYIVGAHYDSVDNPGADDDASGVAALLEIALILSRYETEYTIKYIAFDMEEWGLIGSDAYVEDHLADDIRGMVELDMIAFDSGTYATRIYGRAASNPLKNAVAAAIDEYGNALGVSIYGRFDASDHAPFEWAGFQACLLIEDGWGSNPNYHRPTDSVDTPGYISYEYAADHVRAVAGFLADYAVVVVEPCEGDLNGDGVVDATDLSLVLAHYGMAGVGYEDGDLDGDSDVDLTDLTMLLSHYGESCL